MRAPKPGDVYIDAETDERVEVTEVRDGAVLYWHRTGSEYDGHYPTEESEPVEAWGLVVGDLFLSREVTP